METSFSLAPTQPHLVHFYESDEFLAGAVAQFAGEGAGLEEPLLLVLTPEHRALFNDRLREHGLDVERALAGGTLVELDAQACLSKFMKGELPDPALFDHHVGGALRELQARFPGRPIRAFGEMVDILWRSGKQAAAVRLEGLWTELQTKLPFSLFCAYLLSDFLEARSRQTLGALHTHVVHRHDKNGKHAKNGKNGVEDAIRNSLRQTELTEVALRASERRLREVTDSVPVLVSYIDRDHRYRFANRTYETWFGIDAAAVVGQHMRDVLGEEAYAVIGPKVDAALEGHEVRYSTRAAYKFGGVRDIEAVYTPHRSDDGEVQGVTALVNDITERVRLREAAAAAARKTERLLKVTAAVADAVTPEQVYEALVDQVAAALGATRAGLWVLGDDQRAHVKHTFGMSEQARTLDNVPLDGPERLPVLDALRNGELLWFESREVLVERYPNVAPDRVLGPKYQLACVPLVVRGESRAVLAFAFDDGAKLDHDDEQPFLLLLARYGSQAIERLRLLAGEKRDRAQAELLFALAQTVIRAEKVEDVFTATLEAIESSVGAKRSAILVYDAEGVMRFKAWHGLSDEYRRAVEGHSPWARDAVDPQVVWVGDAAASPDLAPYRDLFRRERIGALGFIPLVAGGKLLGKFMLYYERPHTLAPHELGLVRAIANHIAAATVHFEALDELQRSVRFNEMFTAILGHDLRNPLSAIMTAAQLLLKRNENERSVKPLSRIVTSGDRMARMIDQLLDFTRVRVGAGIPLAPKLIDLKPVVQLVVEELDDPNPDIEIVLELDGDTSGQWDPDRLAQVFSNLVGNAVQHGRQAGRVTVRIDGSKPDSVSVSVHNHGAVPAERLKRLFEPMTGADRRGEKSEGLGLGLYISLEIARAHGGTIAVESGDKTGTSFHVTLPRAPT